MSAASVHVSSLRILPNHLKGRRPPAISVQIGPHDTLKPVGSVHGFVSSHPRSRSSRAFRIPTADSRRMFNYNLITDDLVVGSCPRGLDYVESLKADGVSVVVNLQQDRDLSYDIGTVMRKCEELGMEYVRHPIVDFDNNSLQRELLAAVKTVVDARRSASKGALYVHCTAGMHRSTTVLLAYMWCVLGMHVEDAFALMRSKRRQAIPSVPFIRKTVADALYAGEAHENAPEAAAARHAALLEEGQRLTDKELETLRAHLGVAQASER